MRLVTLVVVVALVTACGRSPVDACHEAVEAENDLECVAPADFRNAEAECASLASATETQQDERMAAGVKACARDLFCGDDALVAYYECRAESAHCTESGQPSFADSCDDHLPR